MERLPPSSYHFRVAFSNPSFGNDANFTSVSGIDARLVFDNDLTQKPAGAVFGNIILSRPLKLPSKLTFFILNVINERRIEHLNFKIELLDSNNEPAEEWFITEGQPVRYALDEFNALKSAIATEIFEFRCGGIHLSPPKEKPRKPIKK